MKKLFLNFLSLCMILGLFFVVPSQAAEEIEVKIHGELEYEFSTSNAEDIEPQFQLDKFVIQPKVKLGDFLKFSAQWYARQGTKDESESYLNEFHAKFLRLPLDTYLDFGLFERTLKDHHSRITETYSLYGNAFYRDDSMTIAWGNWEKKHKAPPFYWLVSVGEGFKIGHKQPAEQTSKYDGSNKDKMIQDDLGPKISLKYPEAGINIGINQKLGEAKVDLMGFYYTDKLSESERRAFERYLSNDQKAKLDEDNGRQRVGAQANVKIGHSRIFAGFLSAMDAGLGRMSYVFEASYKFKIGEREIFKSITPVVSYSAYTIDGSPEFTKAESWDRTQIILACIIDVLEKTKFKVEYIINDEETGGTGTNPTDIDNNEFLVQLEVKF
ncbi:MAG: hypothetical protein ACE5WD_10930 [Candidatus Aminicenantia bacterium]